MATAKLLGEILIEDFGLAQAALDDALAAQAENGRRIGEILVGTKALTPAQLSAALGQQLELESLETIPAEAGNGELLELVPITFLKEYRVFLLERDNGRLKVAVADPLDSRPLNDLAAITGADIEPVVAPPEEIIRAINRAFERHSGEAQEFVEDIGGGGSLAQTFEPADLLDASDEAPIIRFVNSLITQGYKERASDIHIEPFETELIVRYRIDGILYEVLRPPHKAQASIISRLKIMSGLNIAEKRLPQDGRFRVRIAGKDVDVRVSSLPTAFGERVVLRLLDKSSNVLTLEDIGMDPEMLRQVNGMIHKSHGIFLVTGPTGSGKTT
ncbi:MAG TPA: ATPase, T2SS/T4P/T4SS family, partial [Desulfuromonadales bacterium]|nr:ATPase, T2SS/T4P/T4SS family [Desulfuromonadales bacterium]